MSDIPSQSQLIFPLLETLDSCGGRTDTRALYDEVAARVGVDKAAREHRESVGKRGMAVNLFERHVRWAQQRAKFMKLIAPVEHCHWCITGKGRTALREARHGVVITFYENENGVALFARAEDAIGYIEDQSVQLILTSPPYPLLREKDYGNVRQEEYLDWFLNIAKDWPQKMTKDGSIVLNLGDVWERGRPTLSLYQERLLIRLFDELGLRLCQRFAWLNNAKMPAPAEWVTVWRVRVKPSLEQIYWLSPHDQPFADNRAVLRAYSPAMQKRLAAGGEKCAAARPSGHVLTAGAFGSVNGGSIPDNLLIAANTASGSAYIRYCKEQELPIHPARFPATIPEFFIRLLSRQEDIVYDPFGGSLTTAKAAQDLGRRWVCSETALEYLQGGIGGRFRRGAVASGG